MAAPLSLDPTTFSSMSMNHVKLTPTAQGMRAFLIKIPSLIGPHLTQTLLAAQENYRNTASWAPADTKHEALFQHIFNRLVPALEGNDPLLVRMSQACGTNGPLAINWLSTQLDPKSESSSLLQVITIINTNISDRAAIADIPSMYYVSNQ